MKRSYGVLPYKEQVMQIAYHFAAFSWEEADQFISRMTGHVRTAGLVVARQKSPTARGFAFWLIEDNQERAQVVIPPALWEAKREVIRDGRLIC